MKKMTILSLALMAALSLSACSKAKPKFEDTRKHTASTTTKETSSSTKGTSQSTTEAKTKSELWSKEKDSQLAEFIKKWGANFSPVQTYTAYNPEKNGNFYGVSIPDDLTQPKGFTPDFEGENPKLVWSEDGQAESDQYALVATYSDIENSQYPSAHLYLFTIKDGKAQVWISQQNQGNNENKFYFTETQNYELQNFFVSLVTGVDQSSLVPEENSQPSVDTKNLTVEQCSNWAKAHKAVGYGSPYSRVDFTALVTGIDKSPDGLVYIEVRENHDSPTMRASGADPNVASNPSFYRINADGHLELEDILSRTYTVVSTTYFESKPPV